MLKAHGEELKNGYVIEEDLWLSKLGQKLEAKMRKELKGDVDQLKEARLELYRIQERPTPEDPKELEALNRSIMAQFNHMLALKKQLKHRRDESLRAIFAAIGQLRDATLKRLSISGHYSRIYVCLSMRGKKTHSYWENGIEKESPSILIVPNNAVNLNAKVIAYLDNEIYAVKLY